MDVAPCTIKVSPKEFSRSTKNRGILAVSVTIPGSSDLEKLPRCMSLSGHSRQLCPPIMTKKVTYKWLYWFFGDGDRQQYTSGEYVDYLVKISHPMVEFSKSNFLKSDFSKTVWAKRIQVCTDAPSVGVCTSAVTDVQSTVN